MANIAALLQNIQGQNTDPLATLLQSRGAPVAPFSSTLQPQEMPNLIQQQAQAQDLSSDFYTQLSNISDSITQQRQAAEDEIAQNAQKAQQEALMRKIRAMIPQATPSIGPSYTGGGGAYYPVNTGGILGSPGKPKGGGGGSILPNLPDVSKGTPRVAPGCTAHMVELGLCG